MVKINYFHVIILLLLISPILSTDSKNKEETTSKVKLDKFYLLGSKCSTVKNERPIELAHETRPETRARFRNFFHNFSKNLIDIKEAFKKVIESAPPADRVDYAKVGNYIHNKGKLQRLHSEDLAFLKQSTTKLTFGHHNSLTQLVSTSQRVPRQPDAPMLHLQFIDVESYRKIKKEFDIDGDDEDEDDDDDDEQEEEDDTD